MSGSMYLPLWTDAYLGDTRHLSTVQHGAYLLLLMVMWRNGGHLPNDEKLLARTAGMSLDKWRKASPEVLAFFEVEGSTITQKRLKLELEKSLGLVQKRATAGRTGGQAKALKTKERALANATNVPKQNPSLQILDPDLVEEIDNPLPSEDPPAGGQGEPAPASRRRSRSTSGDSARGTRIPSDWRATDEHYAVAKKLGLSERQTDKEADKFFDWWSAKSGKDARKVDWMATWRTWCRNASDFGGSPSQAKPARRMAI